MRTPPAAIRAFLDAPHLAVVGVSRDPNQAANHVFRKLHAARANVFPVNPATARVESGPCYPSLAAIPGGVDAVMLVTPPAAAVTVVREALAIGVRRIWFHRAFGQGSLSREAVALVREAGLTPIVGGCPMMYVEPVDPFHACCRWVLEHTAAPVA